MILILSWLACSTATPPEEAPPGQIGGQPILDWPVVIGGISLGSVESGIEDQRAAIEACDAAGRAIDPGLAGKVLVRFQVLADGTVAEARVHSTSLRDAPTEDCLLAAIRGAHFQALQSGELAVVFYPFTFAPP